MNNILEAYGLQSELINDVILEPDLAIALAMVRMSLGIKGNGTAHIWLDCIAERDWQANVGNTRADLIADYIQHLIAHCINHEKPLLDVKAWRKERNLTQEQAAQLLGITPRQYQRIEAGHSRLSGSVRRLMEIL